MPLSHSNGNGSRTIWMAIVGGLGALALVYGIVKGATSELDQRIEQNKGRIDKVESWQFDYMTGKIPSSAETAIAAIKEQIVEQETQIRKNLEYQNEKDRMYEENLKRYDELLIAVAKLESFLQTKYGYRNFDK